MTPAAWFWAIPVAAGLAWFGLATIAAVASWTRDALDKRLDRRFVEVCTRAADDSRRRAEAEAAKREALR